jgi:hypothetical protein
MKIVFVIQFTDGYVGTPGLPVPQNTETDAS